MKNNALLSYGQPIDVLRELDGDIPNNAELRAALMNSLERIDSLEKHVQALTAAVRELLKK